MKTLKIRINVITPKKLTAILAVSLNVPDCLKTCVAVGFCTSPSDPCPWLPGVILTLSHRRSLGSVRPLVGCLLARP